MKVKELKKINKFAHENCFNLDYRKLLNLDAKDISRILNLIDEKSMNAKSLITFFTWEISNPDWKEKFGHIEGIADFNVREYIIGKIVNANSPTLSEAIYYYFDLDSDLDLFKDIHEYQTYVENITAKMNDNDNTTCSNVKFILKRVPLNIDRNELIKNVMRYSQSNYLSPQDLDSYFESLDFPLDFNEILLLLLKGYNIDKVQELLDDWNFDARNIENNTDEVNKSYETVKEYLLKSELPNYCGYKKSLIEIFCTNEYEDYEQIVNLLTAVEKARDEELFERCLILGPELSNENIKYYINEILKIGSSNGDFRYSLFALLKNKISEDNKAKAVVEVVRASNKVDFSSRRTTKFIIDLQNIDLIINMPITKENHDTREVIYREFPKCVAYKELNDNQTAYYSDLLKRLCSLPADICEKVIDILSLTVVKNMDIEQQSKLKELILNTENHGSLKYIYARYIEKEKEYEQHCANKIEQYDPEVSLMTVVELLECNHDIDKVLDDFGDDDEITPRTLIRSLAYKNNQNN